MANYHQNLYAHENGPYAYALKSGKNFPYKDGAFSRVIFLSAGAPASRYSVFGMEGPLPLPVVLKVTSCPPTIALLESLAEKDAATPGLPRVLVTYGPCASSDDNLVFKGYTVEELYPAVTADERLKVAKLLGEVAELEQYFIQRGYVGWQLSYLTTRVLASRDSFNLGEAFSIISKLIKAEQAVLDLHQPGNVLLDANGDLCLADPVAALVEVLDFEDAPDWPEHLVPRGATPSFSLSLSQH